MKQTCLMSNLLSWSIECATKSKIASENLHVVWKTHDKMKSQIQQLISLCSLYALWNSCPCIVVLGLRDSIISMCYAMSLIAVWYEIWNNTCFVWLLISGRFIMFAVRTGTKKTVTQCFIAGWRQTAMLFWAKRLKCVVQHKMNFTKFHAISSWGFKNKINEAGCHRFLCPPS